MRTWHWCVLLALGCTPLLWYAADPFDTGTWDPRARLFGVTWYRISSQSMHPTLARGDLVIVSLTDYLSEPPKRGDVIVFRYPEDRSVHFIFRVIGTPGDTVRMAGGETFVNDVALDEPYIAPADTQFRPLAEGEWAVGDGELFVLGDNRGNARDSRYWGNLPRDDVVGRSWYRLGANGMGAIE